MKPNELVVESMKHCFICLDPIPSHFPVEREHESGLRSIFTHSLWSFSTYLKMDIGKVFNNKDSIPRHLLAKVRKSELKGELCDDCSLMNNKFSKLYWKLIKIEMELACSLQNFQSKFRKANEAGESSKLRHLANSMDGLSGGLARKLDILEFLRAEAIQKCSRKLNDRGVSVKIENLTMKQVNLKTKKFKRSSSMGLVGQIADFEADSEAAKGQFKSNINSPQASDGEPNPTFENNRSNVSLKIESPPQSSKCVSDFDDEKSYGSEDSNMKVDVKDLQTCTSTINSTADPSISSKLSFRVVTSTVSESLAKKEAQILKTKTGKFKCTICSSEFNYKNSAQIHYRNFHLNEKYKCSVCAKEYNSFDGFDLHYKATHVGVRYKCNVCDKMYAWKKSLDMHQLKSSCGRGVAPTSIPNPFICKFSRCGKRFTTKHCLQTHFRDMHLQTDKYECKICQTKFRWLNNLKRHLQKLHSVSWNKNDF